jgi:hypothetical protein
MPKSSAEILLCASGCASSASTCCRICRAREKKQRERAAGKCPGDQQRDAFAIGPSLADKGLTLALSLTRVNSEPAASFAAALISATSMASVSPLPCTMSRPTVLRRRSPRATLRSVA